MSFPKFHPWMHIVNTVSQSLIRLKTFIPLSLDSSYPNIVRYFKLTLPCLLPARRPAGGVNLRPAGGVFEHPPCGFSRIARKRRRAAPPGFHLPYPPSFWQLVWKFRSWVVQGQVTRSGQVTIPYKNFTIAPQLQCLRESYETFGIW